MPESTKDIYNPMPGNNFYNNMLSLYEKFWQKQNNLIFLIIYLPNKIQSDSNGYSREDPSSLELGWLDSHQLISR